MGYQIHVVMTNNATKFISPVTFASISQNPVLIDTFEEPMAHISLAEKVDLFIIAPASYNIIGKIAHGIADDLLTTISAVVTCRKLIAPAMNSHMYENPILQNNLKKLKENNYQIIEPESGILACGYEGIGRLRNTEDILNIITNGNIPSEKQLPQIYAGKHILITAGGTQEPIDPVRYIGNHSSGKMGIALAKAARDMGAKVTLIHANIKTHLPKNISSIKIQTAEDMLNALKETINQVDILLMSAAVSDYRMNHISSTKIKKNNNPISLQLTENPDILKSLIKFKKPGQFFIGFSAESNDLIENAKIKLEQKKLDAIIANDISKKDIGFNSDYNAVTILFSNNHQIDIPSKPKYDIGIDLLNHIHNTFYKKNVE